MLKKILFSFGIVIVLTLISSCSLFGSSEENNEATEKTVSRKTSTLSFAVNDFPDGWNPASSAWSGAATTIARSFLDPLAVMSDEGTWAPYLADFESSDDFKTWTVTLQPNIIFHNGEKLNAEVMISNLENSRGGIVLGPPLLSVEELVAESELVVRIELSEPNASFPVLFTSQGGYMFSQETIQAFQDGIQKKPIGTGPWVMETQGENQIVVSKNPNYWRSTPENPIPKIEKIVFVAEPDEFNKSFAIQDMNYDAGLENTPRLLAEWQRVGTPENLRLVTDAYPTDRYYGIFNTQEGPFTDVKLREAATLGLDREKIAELAMDGFFPVTNGPYSQESPWWVDIGWPPTNKEQARNIVQEWKTNNEEIPPIRIVVSQGLLNLSVAQEVARQWEEIGLETTVESIPTSTFILNLVRGDFDALFIQQFSSRDPAADENFWREATIAEPGNIGLNFPRFSNETTESALAKALATNNFEERKEAYETAWREWGKEFPYIFLFNSQVGVIHQKDVNGIGSLMTPNGEKASPMSWGATWLTEAYFQ